MRFRAARCVLIVWAALVLAIVAPSRTAWAQSISASGQIYAERFINHVDVGQSTRPMNLNPLGINYSDCIQDMVLQFTVTLSGFNGSDSMEIWATTTGDCSMDANRGAGAGVTQTQAVCWLVNHDLIFPNIQAPQTKTFSIPVRALVGPENQVPTAGTLVGDQGPDACTHQSSFGAVSITVWFLPILSNRLLDTAGTPYQYPAISADLVAPPPPTGVSIGPGDTLFVVHWMPNIDADTIGYDVFIDPPPGGPPADAASGTPQQVFDCPDSSASTGPDADAIANGSTDATTDAPNDAPSDDASNDGSTLSEGAPPVVDAASTNGPDACRPINGGGALPTGSGANGCTSVALLASPVSGTQVTGPATTTTDDAGLVTGTDSGSTGGGGTGGIASIPCQYLVNASCPAGTPAYGNTHNPSVTAESSSSLTITGLLNGPQHMYNVVVAAVDGSGNVGPQSSPLNCDFPDLVNDFWKLYKADGGQAGGSFCALETAGAPTGLTLFSVGFGAVAFALVRRRRKDGK